MAAYIPLTKMLLIFTLKLYLLLTQEIIKVTYTTYTTIQYNHTSIYRKYTCLVAQFFYQQGGGTTSSSLSSSSYLR